MAVEFFARPSAMRSMGAGLRGGGWGREGDGVVMVGYWVSCLCLLGGVGGRGGDEVDLKVGLCVKNVRVKRC